MPQPPNSNLRGLVDELYEDMRREARRLLADRPFHTLQPTALLNEALVRLLRRRDEIEITSEELRVYAAKAMRSVLVDHARTKGAAKRGSGRSSLPLDAIAEPADEASGQAELLAIHEALELLSADTPEYAGLAETRYFGRMSVQEVARTYGVPESRVKVACQCLRRLLSEEA